MSKEKLWDVVIYHAETKVVESIPGVAMRREIGFHNAEKRLDTVIGRINHNYHAAIVPSGVYHVGSIVSEQHA